MYGPESESKDPQTTFCSIFFIVNNQKAEEEVNMRPVYK